MNIGFLTRLDPKDINNWSGIFYYRYNKLKEKHHVEIIGTELVQQLSSFTTGNFPAGSYFPVDRYVKHLGRLLSERIRLLKCDLIFFGDLFFIPSDINIPFVFCSDLIFEQVKVHHLKPDERDIEPCMELERFILNRASRIIFCSEWIKKRTIKVYDIDPVKIDVVEFGANISNRINYSIDINMDICKLTFIGKEWKRKGGDRLLQMFKLLKKEKFPCKLTIIGSTPPDEQEYDKDLVIIPFLDKSDKEQSDKLCKILSESHFLVLPTEFDAYGIVFCEASAYALPSITANVGGVSQPVKEGKNGFLLPHDATAQDYADKIKNVFNDRESYIWLRDSSRREFETRLNWDVWGERMDEIFEKTVIDWNACK